VLGEMHDNDVEKDVETFYAIDQWCDDYTLNTL
jgi:hypothetical protein